MLEKVTASIEELGFVRNDLARQLKRGSGTTLGMVVLSLTNPFFAELTHACEIAAEELGYTVVLGSSDQSVSREQRYIELFEEQRVHGMLVVPVGDFQNQIARLRQRGMSFVLFGAPEPDVCSIALDGVQGGYLATRHLIESGYRNVGFVGGPMHQIRDRWEGASSAAQTEVGVRLTQFPTDDQTMADGYAIGDVISRLPANERPDGIFAANDMLALGVIQALQAAGLRVPHDVGVVGYDDIGYANALPVPLTTVRQNLSSLAGEAIAMVLDEADNSDHEHTHRKVAAELIIRQSASRG